MGMQLLQGCQCHHYSLSTTSIFISLSSSSSTTCSSLSFLSNCRQVGLNSQKHLGFSAPLIKNSRVRSRSLKSFGTVASSNVASPQWDSWKPGKTSPSFSDVLWPSAGAFAAMALLGKIDQLLAPKGISMTIAPLGAVCAVLFVTPSAPAARKYNMFMAQIGCAAIGVLAFSIFGPGWVARSAGLAAAIAFMICTRSAHPPAASLPLLFVDGIKLHHLNFWYALFPGAASCILLCLIQEVVCYLKENFKF